MALCAVCGFAGMAPAETIDLSLRLENGEESYTYRSEISKTEIIGANSGTSREIREYDVILKTGDVDPLARTREVFLTYDRIYFSVQTETPPSELTYDSSDPENQNFQIKGTLDHVVGMTVVMTLHMDTGALLSTDVPTKPGITERQSSLSAFVSVADLEATVGDMLSCRAGKIKVDEEKGWTLDRGIRLRGMNAPTPTTRDMSIVPSDGDGVRIEYTGDIELNTGAYNLQVTDSGLEGHSVWDSASGLLQEQREVIHGEMSGERKGEPVIVSLRREQEITRR
jgi:hypothetical protein